MNGIFKKLVLTVVFLMAAAMVRAEDASVVRATRVDGTVTQNGMPLKEGDVIGRDGRIEAKAGSAAVLTWSQGSMVELYADTTIVLRGIVFESDRKLEKSLLVMEKGRVFVKAQVPEHIFSHFEISAGSGVFMSQGAEFALKYSPAGEEFTVWSLLGRVVVTADGTRWQIDDGQQHNHKKGGPAGSASPMPEKTKDALLKASNRLGGSLLMDDGVSSSSGGPLKVKIGGVRNRRGNAPYTVQFKAGIGGGSGRYKNIQWDFGDGESVAGREAKHVFTQGVYVVVLTVEDENGMKASAQLNISVEEDCGC